MSWLKTPVLVATNMPKNCPKKTIIVLKILSGLTLTNIETQSRTVA